jgi:hypothetical protein
VVLRSDAHAPEVYPMIGLDRYARADLHAGGVIVVRSGLSAQAAMPRHMGSVRLNAHS